MNEIGEPVQLVNKNNVDSCSCFSLNYCEITGFVLIVKFAILMVEIIFLAE